MLKCPACSCELSEVKVSACRLDVCQNGCGGVWFDADELKHFDELQEEVPAQILRPLKNQHLALDRAAARNCVRCKSSPMKREIFENDFLLELDICPDCKGIWLDLGELHYLRKENTTKAEINEVVTKACEDYAKIGNNPEMQKRLHAFFNLLFK